MGPSAAPQSAGSRTGLCTLFSTAEIATYLGQPVAAGETGGPQGTDCQWPAAQDATAFVQIQKVPANYFEDPTSNEGYHAVTGLGQKASSRSRCSAG